MNPLHKPYDCRRVGPPALSRREMLKSAGAGLGFLAFASLASEAAAAYQSPLEPKAPHFAPRAKRVICLTMQGGPSHMDTFDYKPRLAADAGKAADRRGNKLVAPIAPFRRRGESGLWISDLFEKVAEHADDLCLLRGMRTDLPNHPQAFVQMHTGNIRFARPSVGAWTLYGLGTENQNLPGFITINPPSSLGGARNYGSSFLPAVYQGTRIEVAAQRGKRGKRSGAESAIGYIENPSLSRAQQREQLDLLQAMNRDLLDQRGDDSEVEGVIQSYELAFRMQREVPEVMDLSGESAATLKQYGVGERRTDRFGRQCLLARRFAEAGVRFVEIAQGGWDHHNNLRRRLEAGCQATDGPIAALLEDLKQRGLLKDTLVVWGGEFGRTPQGAGGDGRNHNSKGYTMWLAGGGVKGGHAHGATDEYGAEAVENPVHIHDLHATILHLLGLDHKRLTYRYAGRDFRLTDVYGNVARDVLG